MESFKYLPTFSSNCTNEYKHLVFGMSFIIGILLKVTMMVLFKNTRFPKCTEIIYISPIIKLLTIYCFTYYNLIEIRLKDCIDIVFHKMECSIWISICFTRWLQCDQSNIRLHTQTQTGFFVGITMPVVATNAAKYGPFTLRLIIVGYHFIDKNFYLFVVNL